MPAARFIRTLTEAESEALRRLYRTTSQADLRTRCQMVLFSVQGRTVAEIARLTWFDEDTVLYWLERYEQAGLPGLEDRPGRGRPPKSNRRGPG